jgi:hypothetical protein
MAVPSLANTWRCVLRQSCNGFHAENVFHVDAPTLSDPADVANDVATAWGDNNSITKIQSNKLFIDGLDVQPYDGSSAPISFGPGIFTNDNGQAADAPVPPQVCAIITEKTLTSGRSHRGRLYIAGMRETYLNTNQTSWDTSHATLNQDVADFFLSTLRGGAVVDNLVVYSALLNSASVVSSVVFRMSYLGTQRRRAEQFQ